MEMLPFFMNNRVRFLVLMVFIIALVACDGDALPPSGEELSTPGTSSAVGSYPAPPPAEAPPKAYPGQLGGEETYNVQTAVTENDWPLFNGRLLFHSERSGQLSVFTLDGSNGRIDRVTENGINSFEPAWSPDCQSVVYAAEPSGNNDFEIFTINANGENNTQLFDSPDVLDWGPDWSPDGKTIAYQNNQNALINICFFDLETNTQSCLEQGNYSNANAEWSPDGSHLLFSSNRDGDWEIFVMEVDSDAPPTQLTDNKYTDLRPHYSPDGQTIAYDAQATGQFDVFVMNADGSNQRQLTTDPADDRGARWVGDDWIAFTSLRTLDGDIYLVRPDGSEQMRITDAIGLDDGIDWCPTP